MPLKALRLTTSTPMPQYQKESVGKIFTALSIHILCHLGLECDQYAILGEILNIDTIENLLTGKELYVLTVETNELQFDVCVPVEKVIGEPAIGRRLKAQIWLQGHINF